MDNEFENEILKNFDTFSDFVNYATTLEKKSIKINPIFPKYKFSIKKNRLMIRSSYKQTIELYNYLKRHLVVNNEVGVESSFKKTQDEKFKKKPSYILEDIEEEKSSDSFSKSPSFLSKRIKKENIQEIEEIKEEEKSSDSFSKSPSFLSKRIKQRDKEKIIDLDEDSNLKIEEEKLSSKLSDEFKEEENQEQQYKIQNKEEKKEKSTKKTKTQEEIEVIDKKLKELKQIQEQQDEKLNPQVAVGLQDMFKKLLDQKSMKKYTIDEDEEIENDKRKNTDVPNIPSAFIQKQEEKEKEEIFAPVVKRKQEKTEKLIQKLKNTPDYDEIVKQLNSMNLKQILEELKKHKSTKVLYEYYLRSKDKPIFNEKKFLLASKKFIAKEVKKLPREYFDSFQD